MQLQINRKITGREMLTNKLDPDKTMFELFSEMWRELDKGLSYHNIDSQGEGAEVTFTIRWEGK